MQKGIIIKKLYRTCSSSFETNVLDDALSLGYTQIRFNAEKKLYAELTLCVQPYVTETQF